MALIEVSIGGFCTVWVAFLVGVILGWAWKPKWANFGRHKLSCSVSKSSDLCIPSSPSRSVMSPLKGFGSAPCLNSFKMASEACESWVFDNRDDNKPCSVSPTEDDECSVSQLNEEQSNVVTKEDLEHLVQLIEMKDKGPTWIQMMDRSIPNMSYQAWRRDPKTGPPKYHSRTVFEDATPKLVRDFFWDDEFRPKWDTMLAHSATIEECPKTGTMVVKWIRKFPFFCSDREYIICRRIWKPGRSFYYVTKGLPYPSISRCNKPRRVDLYYSSWCIQAVESRRGDGQLTACEVLLFHHEDMGIPREIAKLGIQQGMWGAVKKTDPVFRAYQRERSSGRSAFMAQINSKINSDDLISVGCAENLSETEVAATSNKPLGRSIPKLVIIGGAVVLACSLDLGLFTKAFIFGVARRFINMGKRT